MSNIFLDTINGNSSSRPPVWFMRQAGRILPSYRKLKEKHHFYDMMKDSELASEVTLLPINDLDVDSVILFSDIIARLLMASISLFTLIGFLVITFLTGRLIRELFF